MRLKSTPTVLAALLLSACNLFDPSTSPPSVVSDEDGAMPHQWADVAGGLDTGLDAAVRDAGGDPEVGVADMQVDDIVDLDAADAGDFSTTLDADMSTDVGPDLPPDMGPVRVTTGLTTLWDFAMYTDGGGVPDSSGVAPPMTLTRAAGNVTVTSDGATVDDEGALATGDATRVHAAMSDGTFTVELWFTPGAAAAANDARIITISSDITLRNFSLIQDIDILMLRLRTNDTALNGDTSAGEVVQNGFPFREVAGLDWTGQMHLVVTYEGGVLTAYVDSVEVGQWNYGAAGLSNWDPDFQLILGAEFDGSRRWAGTFHLGAIYDQALTSAEIATNYAAGVP